MPIRIVIADDADLVIHGARAVLMDEYRYQVVGTARSVTELLTLMEQAAPDLVLLSEWLYNLDILTAVERLRAIAPQVKLVVTGGLADGLLIRELLLAGVNSYLYKCDDLCELLPIAVDTVMRGRAFLSPTASAEYLVATQKATARSVLDKESRQVLQLLAQGYPTPEIAKILDISSRRVYWIREKLRKRFDARTNEHLIQRAASEGFLYPSD